MRVVAHKGFTQSEPVSASTRIVNSPPVIGVFRLEPENAGSRGELRAFVQVNDADDDEVSLQYSWTLNGKRVSEDSGVLSTASLRRGDRVSASVVASDGSDQSVWLESEEITLGNANPSFVSSPEPAGSDGVFRYQPVAEDPEGDRALRFSVVSGPDGMALDPAQGIEWRPGKDQAGTHVIELAVEDSEGGRAVQRFEVVVGVADTVADAAPPASP